MTPLQKKSIKKPIKLKKIDNNKSIKKDIKPKYGKMKLKIKQQSKTMPERHNEKFLNILGQLEEIFTKQGEHFRARAYKNAQEVVMEMTEDLKTNDQLKGKKGIGKTIIEKFEEYLETGTLEILEKEKNNPMNVLTNVYGIGPQKAKELIKSGITTIDDLKKNKDKLNDKQLVGLQYYDAILERIPRSEIEQYKTLFTDLFKKAQQNKDANFEIVGSFRRGAETSGDIDIIINDKPTFDQFIKDLVDKNIIVEMLTDGKTKKLTVAQLPGKTPRRIDFLYSSPVEYAFAILYFTGSKAFNVVMRRRATSLNLTLNEHGLSTFNDKVKGDKIKGTFPNEESIFNYLSLEYKTPEERKDGRYVIVNEDIKNLEEKEPTKIKIKPKNKTLKKETAHAPEPKPKNKSSKIKIKLKAKPDPEPEPEPEPEHEHEPEPLPKLESIPEKNDFTQMLFKIDSKNKKRQWRVWVEVGKLYTEHGVVDGKLIKSKPTEFDNNEKAEKRALKLWNDKQKKELYSLEQDKETTPLFRPMLAKSFDPIKNNKYPYLVQPKLDGVRCVAYKKDGEWILESRTGKAFEILDHIKKELSKIDVPENFKLDGELGSFGPDPALTFQQATGIIKRKTSHPSEKYIEYHLYDIFDKTKPDEGFENRWKKLTSIFPKKSKGAIHLCDLNKVKNLEEIQKAHTSYVENGYEGLIIRYIDGKYEPDHRSSSLLKYKTFMDKEYKIVGFKEGKGNDIRTIIFTCETDTGRTFEVRPKGTREERTKMLENAEDYIDKNLTVKFFELTDKGVPRFPVGLVVRDYE